MLAFYDGFSVDDSITDLITKSIDLEYIKRTKIRCINNHLINNGFTAYDYTIDYIDINTPINIEFSIHCSHLLIGVDKFLIDNNCTTSIKEE